MDDPDSAIESAHHFLYDGLGSTRSLTTEVATVEAAYNYTPFGSPLGFGLGNTDTSNLFAGEWFDSSLGYSYNRARYYDTETGRFTGFDPVEDEGNRLHRYVYCGGDGVNRLDPSGQFQLLDVLGALITRVYLFALSHQRALAVIGFVVNVFIPEEMHNAMYSSGIPGMTQLGAAGRAEARAFKALKGGWFASWINKYRGIAGQIWRVHGEEFQEWVGRRLCPGAAGPIRTARRSSIDFLWRNFLIEVKSGKSWGAAERQQLAKGAAHAIAYGNELRYLFLFKPRQSVVKEIHDAGGAVVYLFD